MAACIWCVTTKPPCWPLANDFDSGSLESYINTRVLAERLQLADRDVSRAKLRAALTDLHNLDLGAFHVNYAAAP